MTTYYWTIALVFVFSLFAEVYETQIEGVTQKRKKSGVTKFFLFLTTFVLIFVAGSRYYVGTDYGAYYKGLTTFAPRLKEAVKSFDEPGLPFLATVVLWFTNDGAWFIMTCAALTIGLFMITIFKNTESYIMSAMLFTLIVWNGTFNGVRQYLASAILFCGHRYIFEKKLIKWLLVVLLASCFHISAVVMVVLYFLLRNKIRIRNVLLLALGTFIVSANYDKIFSFIGLLKDSEIGVSDYMVNSVSALRILVSCAPAIAVLFIYIQKDANAEETFYINSLIIHGAAMVAASNSTYLARIGIYSSPFVCVALPRLFHLKNNVSEMLMRIGIVLLYGIFFYVEVSKSSALNNFRFIWTSR